MVMTYQSLIGTKGAAGSIKSAVNSDSIDPATTVDEGLDLIFQKLRHWQMISTATGTVAAGDTGVPVPSRFRQSVLLEMTGPTAIKLTPKLPFEIENLRFYVGTAGAIGTSAPNAFAIKGTMAEFPSAADQTYLYRWVHFADPIPLGTSTSGTTVSTSTGNFVTAQYPRVMRAATNAQAWEFLENQQRKLYWMTILTERIDEVNAEAAQAAPGADQGWPSNYMTDG